MSNKILPTALAASIVLLSGCQKASHQIVITNPTASQRTDEPISIDRNRLKSSARLLPTVVDHEGKLLASQVDDTDGDGKWDQLAFVCDLDRRQTAAFDIVWVKAKDYPQFETRTNVRMGICDGEKIEEQRSVVHGRYNLMRISDTTRTYPYQMNGPGWENDRMGFRQYFDGRNCRDIFGKRVSYMALDSVGITGEAKVGDNFHTMHPWGRDIMSAANSFGHGGLAAMVGDSLVLLGVPPEATTDNVDSTRFTLVTEGAIRSIFRIDYYGWHIASSKIDVKQTTTIWAGQYGYSNTVTTSQLPDGVELVTGLVANNNDMPERMLDYGGWVSMSTHDLQTYHKTWYMGMSLIVDKRNVIDTFDSPTDTGDIRKTWCVVMQPDNRRTYRYNAYAAWELTDPRWADRDNYMQLIDDYGLRLAKPVSVTVK